MNHSLNEQLMARKAAATPRGVGVMGTFFADRAENAELWDVEGRRYIDFAGGIAVMNTGHGHPKVVAAIEAQLERFTHTCYQVVPYESYVALAEKLNATDAGHARQEDGALLHRRRGDRERDQDRALRTRSARA